MQGFSAAGRRVIVAFSLIALSLAGTPAQRTTAGSAGAAGFATLEQRVTVSKLPNGLTLILCRRPEAPVFSFFTLVDAGDANDPGGQSGLAHMFEHLAFKGTEDIGTKDYAAEKLALAKIEDAWAAYDAELRRRVSQDPRKLAVLKAQF